MGSTLSVLVLFRMFCRSIVSVTCNVFNFILEQILQSKAVIIQSFQIMLTGVLLGLS